MAKRKKASKKKAKKVSKVSPKTKVEKPKWGDAIEIGTIRGQSVVVREPMNAAALATMSAHDQAIVVLAYQVSMLQQAVTELSTFVDRLKQATK